MNSGRTSAMVAMRPSSVRWRVFTFLALLTVVNLTDRVSLSIGMPVISHEFALSPVTQGIILSAFFWTYAALQVPGGWLIDRVGPSRVIAAATLIWGAFQMLIMATTGAGTLLAARLGLGAAEAPLFPAGGALIVRWLAPGERARGAVIMDSGSYLGAAIGGITISSLMILLSSWRLAFGVAGLATMLLGIIVLRWLRDDPSKHPGVNAGELALIAGSAPAPDESAPLPRIDRRVAACVMTGRLGWAMINFGLLTWGPSYLAQARGFNLQHIGGAAFIIFGAGFLGSLTAGFLCDALVSRGLRRSSVLRGLLVLSGLAVLAAFLLLPHIADPVAAVAMLAAACFMLCWGSLYWSLPALLAPGRAGLLGGLMNMAGSCGGIAVPILAGFLLQVSGSYDAVLLMLACCAGLYIVGTVLIPLDARNRGVVA
jgi:MFS transporter, ACS family, D-galactonate transporter